MRSKIEYSEKYEKFSAGSEKSDLNDQWVEHYSSKTPISTTKSSLPSGLILCQLTFLLPFWLASGLALLIMGILKRTECPIQKIIPYCSMVYGGLFIVHAVMSLIKTWIPKNAVIKNPDIKCKLKVFSALNVAIALLIAISTIAFAVLTLHHWKPTFDNPLSLSYCNKHLYLLLSTYILLLLMTIFLMLLLPIILLACGTAMFASLGILKKRSRRQRPRRRFEVETGSLGKRNSPTVRPLEIEKNISEIPVVLTAAEEGVSSIHNVNKDTFNHI